MTVNDWPLMLMVWPTGEPVSNSSVAVSVPITATLADEFTSSVVKKRPEPDRPGPHRLPVRDGADHGRRPGGTGGGLQRAGDRRRRRHRGTSGATARSASMAASAVVSVETVPPPPRKPPLVVDELGVTMIMFEPSELICEVICACAPWPRPTVSMTAAMPIRMPSMVSSERIRRALSAETAVRMVSRPLHHRTATATGAESVSSPS